ncbi:MAG: LamG domain-containing protein, partial [Dehalococcoidia bacterium]|nr:LamG domain-containing protein [Dehalococcoidia bacterium]
MNNRKLFYYSFLYLMLCVCVVVRGDLVNRYSFTNGDTTAVDSVGGQNGSLVNGAIISSNAVQFDGVNDYVNLPDGLITGYTAVSFEAWFTRTADSGTWTRIWDFGDTNPSTGAGRNYIFFTPKSGSTTFRYAISDEDPGYNHEENIQTSPTATGVPVYIAVVHNSTTGAVKLYVNGSLASTGTFSIPLSSINNVFSYLGRSLYNPDPYLKGSIDEFRIYDEPLDETVIAQHYLDGPDVIGPSPVVIQETDGSTEVIEGNSTPDTYTVALSSQPGANVTLTVDPDEQLDIGSGPGNSVNFVFHTYDWNSPRTIEVRAYD